jgi:hypothetical protein
MKTLIAGAIFATAALAAPAFAWEGKVVACYNKVWVPAQYSTTKKLVMAAHTEWEHRNGQMVKVWYPAVYKESEHKISDGHYVARKGPCVAPAK